jgi:hypothetical protein
MARIDALGKRSGANCERYVGRRQQSEKLSENGTTEPEMAQFANSAS